MRSESQVSFLLRFICLREYKLDEKYFRNNFYLKYNFNIIYFCFLVHPEHYLLTISFSRQIHFKNNKYSYKSEFYFILNFLSLSTKWCATRQHPLIHRRTTPLQAFHTVHHRPHRDPYQNPFPPAATCKSDC